MDKYLLDTNFVLYCVSNKIDFLAELGFPNIIIPEEVVKELEKISEEGNFKDRQSAKVSLQLIKDLERVSLGRGHVDNLIIEYAKSEKMVVGTMDKKLQERLMKKGARVLAIVGSKKLEII